MKILFDGWHKKVIPNQSIIYKYKSQARGTYNSMISCNLVSPRCIANIRRMRMPETFFLKAWIAYQSPTDMLQLQVSVETDVVRERDTKVLDPGVVGRRVLSRHILTSASAMFLVRYLSGMSPIAVFCWLRFLTSKISNILSLSCLKVNFGLLIFGCWF